MNTVRPAIITKNGGGDSLQPQGKARRWYACAVLSLALLATAATAQTNLAILATDGAWTWYNDPRAVFHNGILYFGYVRNTDGRSVLSAFNPTNGVKTDLWTSALVQKDDHNNPGLLVKQDGTMLALHARHGTDQFFSYRLSTSTNPVTPADWTAEQTIPNTGAGVTYANPYQLAAEGGRIYDFTRNQNFNPTVLTSTNGGTNWSAPQLFIQTGSGSIRPYVKYGSDYVQRIDFLYTDGHPRDVTNSLYHLYYEAGACRKTDGTLVKNFSALPVLHDSGERGSVIYQYNAAPNADPNQWIPAGRAWCWEVLRPTNGNPVCLFTVQRDQVMGTNWFDDRIYYYYARWTGTTWQKRFIAQAGRPLYQSERDYAGGICADPENPNVIYLSSNAQNPFNLSDTTNVPLRASDRYEIYRGVTTDGGLTFTWQAVTTNSAMDNLRPYIPRHQTGPPVLIWFRGIYTTYQSYNCEVVGLFFSGIPRPPQVSLLSPLSSPIALTNVNNALKLVAAITDDGAPQPASVTWTTTAGPANAVFSNPSNATTTASFPASGTYVLRVTADDTLGADFAEVTVIAGPTPADLPDASRALWLKLDESTGTTATDSAGSNHGALSGGTTWRPSGGVRAGAIEFDGASGQIIVPDAVNLDGTTAFTLAYWFNANAYPGDSAGLVSKRNSVSDNNAYTTYLKAADRRIYVDVDGSGNRFSSATLINTGQWYHVAVVFDGSLPSAERARLWINGSLDTTAAETSAAIPNYTSGLRVGNTHPGAANWFNGRVDDVRFYRRALTSQEIAVLAVTNRTPSVSIGPAPAPTNGIAATLTGGVASGSAGPAIAVWTLLSGPGLAEFANSNSAITSVSFNRAGDYTLRLSASDSQAGVAQDMTVTVSPNPNLYEDWIGQWFPGVTNPSVIGIVEDPDGDRVKNLVEFALGMTPSVFDAMPFGSGQPGLPVGFLLNLTGTNYLAMHVQRPVGRLGILYEAEVSQDFLSWINGVQQGSAADNGDGTEIVTFRDVVPVNQAPLRLMRLKLTKSF